MTLLSEKRLLESYRDDAKLFKAGLKNRQKSECNDTQVTSDPLEIAVKSHKRKLESESKQKEKSIDLTDDSTMVEFLTKRYKCEPATTIPKNKWPSAKALYKDFETWAWTADNENNIELQTRVIKEGFKDWQKWSKEVKKRYGPDGLNPIAANSGGLKYPFFNL